MPDNEASVLPPPSPDQRRISAEQFQRANQVISSGNFDYGIQLLLTCCKLDPANLPFRQALRRAEKIKYKNNLRGAALSGLANTASKTRIGVAKRGKDHLKVLELAEDVLARNPWDTNAQMDMAEAADALGLLDLAVWTLEQARQKDPRDAAVNRNLARLYEKRGNFIQAINLWELVRQKFPADAEAQSKVKDLAASDTIARGNYDAVVKPEEASGQVKAGEKTPTAEAGAAQPAVDRVAHEAAQVRARIEADPTNVNAYIQLSRLYRRVNQFDQAKSALEEGLVPTGHQFDLTLELAELEMEPFRRNLALTEEKLKKVPGSEELKKVRIRLLKEINTRELDLFRQKSDRYPHEKSHRFELGVRLLRAGQLDEAIKELQAVRADPRFQWRALLYLGHCFKARNNWRLAQRNFEEALQNLPAGEEATRKELLFILAHGAADAGDLSKAIELGYELANLEFGYRDIGRLLEVWQNRQKQDAVPDS